MKLVVIILNNKNQCCWYFLVFLYNIIYKYINFNTIVSFNIYININYII